jgi:hypothetical protein
MSGIFNQTFENFQNLDQSGKPPFGGFQNNYNAKIYLDENENPPSYDLYLNSNQPQTNFKNSLSGIQESSSLSDAYFGTKNVDIIHAMIQSRIAEESGGQYNIARQSDLQLQIIMRSVYLSYGRNKLDDIMGQVKELNALVTKDAVQVILPNIRQYLGYRKDISTPRHIMSHPVNPSSAGEKTYSLLHL